jgi:hypothetical protein
MQNSRIKLKARSFARGLAASIVATAAILTSACGDSSGGVLPIGPAGAAEEILGGVLLPVGIFIEFKRRIQRRRGEDRHHGSLRRFEHGLQQSRRRNVRFGHAFVQPHIRN